MRLQEHVLQGRYERRAWALFGERSPERLHIFLDAEFYLDRMDILSIVPEGCLFVSHVSAEARQYDYICDPGYAAFIAEDVVSWAQGTFGSPATGNAICGLSLSGLAATHIALRYPQVFSCCLSQSGSYWWNDEWLTGQVGATARGKFWLSVGDGETEEGVTHPPTGLRQGVSQIASVESMAEALAGAGADVRHRVFEGGHEMGPWEKELPEALVWLLN